MHQHKKLGLLRIEELERRLKRSHYYTLALALCLLVQFAEPLIKCL